MTQMQFTARLDDDGRLTLEYDPAQLAALGLSSLPQPEQMRFEQRPATRPSFHQLRGKLGALVSQDGTPVDAVQFVRELRGHE